MTWELAGVVVLFIAAMGALDAGLTALDDWQWRRYMARAMRGETPKRRRR